MPTSSGGDQHDRSDDDRSDEQGNNQNRRTDSWHFEKRLSLDTVVAILGIAFVVGGPVLFFAQSTNTRLGILEMRDENRNKMDEQRAKQDAARDLDARDQRIAVLTQMDKLAEQVTQLRIDLGGVIAAARGVVAVNRPKP